MSFVVVFPEAQLLASLFIVLLLADILFDDITVYPNCTDEIPLSPAI
jgi:hypothetical protein